MTWASRELRCVRDSKLAEIEYKDIISKYSESCETHDFISSVLVIKLRYDDINDKNKYKQL